MKKSIFYVHNTLILSNKIKFHFQEFYNDMSETTDAIRNSDLVGVMHFNHNFSEALQSRINDFSSAETEDIVAGEIDVFLDMGSTYIYI